MSELLDLRGFRAEVSAIAARLDSLQRSAANDKSTTEELALTALSELQTTVEELRVSQEELTSQNEALAESRRALEIEHSRYRALFREAPVAYLVTDPRGIVTEANLAAVELLNVDDRFLLNKPLATFLVPSHRTAMRQRMLSVASTGSRTRAEWDVQPRRRPPLPAAFDIALLHADDAPDALLWLVQDLTIERSLRTWGERLQAELDGAEMRLDATHPAVTFALQQLSATVLDECTLDDVLTRVAETGQHIVAEAAGVSVSLFEQGRPRVGGASAPWVRSVDEVQYSLQEGPCVEALTDGRWHVSDDLDEERRWPRFAAEATAQGVLSALSVPLLVRGARLGVINLYATGRGSFGGESVTIAQQLGEVASVTLANAQVLAASRRLAAELEQALVSRATVDMAKGVLMARLSVDPDTAFEALRDLSQRRHMKLRELAAEIIASPGG